jgi:hypothetical protein
MRMTRIVALIPLLFPPLAAASPIFIEDGGTYNVGSSTNGTYNIQNGTLNILPGADVLSVSEYAYGSGTSITMSGGQVEAGIEVNLGKITISGGQSRGFDNSAYGSDGLGVYLQSSGQITGGTFIGGNSGGQAGSGVVVSAGTADGKPVISTLNISGGTFIGGTGSGGYYGGSTGYSLLSLGDTTVTGGHFLSPIAINSAYGGETDFLGTKLTYQNGILSGLLQNGDPIHVQIYPDFTAATVNTSGTEVSFLSTSSSTPLPTPIPEPTSALIFGLLTTFVLARRRSHGVAELFWPARGTGLPPGAARR